MTHPSPRLSLGEHLQSNDSNTTSSIMSTNAFPFLELPAELRVRIYHFTFANLPTVTDRPSNIIHIPAVIKVLEPKGLLQANSQIRTETNSEFNKMLIAQELDFLSAREKASAEVERLNGERITGFAAILMRRAMSGGRLQLREANRKLAEAEGALKGIAILKARCSKRAWKL